jgi:hypothetical protein
VVLVGTEKNAGITVREGAQLMTKSRYLIRMTEKDDWIRSYDEGTQVVNDFILNTPAKRIKNAREYSRLKNYTM